ncbi:hypothetical protein D5086_033979 [Populus alba]|uniref:Uncharacterized protein n=1 Tax=Populus alba TaxID=43335 RepID=A0ACC4ADZ2_POPAL
MTRIQTATDFGQPGGIEVGMPRKLSESKRLRPLKERKCGVEQVAEAYMLKRDDLKFKGNLLSATGASKSECHETQRVKALRPLRKGVWCIKEQKHTLLKEAMTRNSKAIDFRQPGNRSQNAVKLSESKRYALFGRKCEC